MILGNRSDVKMKVKNKNKAKSGRTRLQFNISDPFFCGPPRKCYTVMHVYVHAICSNRFRDCRPEMCMVVMDTGSNSLGDSS